MPTSDPADRRRPEKPLTARWKIAAIPVLSLILLWTLTHRPTDSGPDAPADTEMTEADSAQPAPAASTELTADAGSPASATPENQQVAIPPEPRIDRNWAVTSLHDVTAFDPFTLRGALEERAALAPPTAPAIADASPEPPAAADASVSAPQPEYDVSQYRLQAVFNSPRGPAAIVDSRIVRIGDELEPGLRIVRITPSGLIVEPADQL